MVARRGRVGEVYNIGGFNEQENIRIVRLIINLVKEMAETDGRYRSMLKVPWM